MLCLSNWLAKLYAWIMGKESSASCDITYHLEDDEK